MSPALVKFFQNVCKKRAPRSQRVFTVFTPYVAPIVFLAHFRQVQVNYGLIPPGAIINQMMSQEFCKTAIRWPRRSLPSTSCTDRMLIRRQTWTLPPRRGEKKSRMVHGVRFFAPSTFTCTQLSSLDCKFHITFNLLCWYSNHCS